MSGDSLPPEAASLVYDLIALRKNQGMKLARLTQDRAGNLFASRAVQAVLDDGIVENPAVAVVQVVTNAVLRLPNLSDRIIADAVLGLGLFLAEYVGQVEPRVIRALETADLGARRRALREHWHRLHQAVGATPPGTPGDRHLRESIEPRIFRDLALLVAAVDDGRAPPAPAAGASRVRSDDAGRSSPGKMLVVGGVAIDHVFQTGGVSLPETSVMATGYERSPGGKGLSQAVAAARLGLDVALIAACGDDEDGALILRHLERENVDISMMKVVKSERTPQTCVIELPDGDSAAVVWHNEDAVSLDIQDVLQHRSIFAECDAVLLTFEIPQDVLSSTLNLVSGLAPEPPVTVVTPGQPYDDGAPSGHALAQIDYLVARTWELRKLTYHAPSRLHTNDLGESFLRLGVKSVCVLGSHGGTFYSQDAPPRSISLAPSMLRESSVTRDLFCAALAARLVEDRSLVDDALRWASAALASFTDDHTGARSLPDRKRVEQAFRTISEGLWR